MRALRVVRYVACLGAVTFWHGATVMLAALARVRHRPGGVYDRACRGWARGLIRGTGLRVSVSGLEHLQPGQSYVFASNHISFVDIWVLFACLPGSARFVAKKELLSVPFFGQAIRASGQIPIDRHNPRDAFAAYDEAGRAIRGGLSAIVFAEGTRSRDGTLRDFKKGPFVLAIAAGVPVVPVRISGSREALPPGGWWVRAAPVTVRIAEPVPTVGLDYEDRDVLMRRVRGAMDAPSPDGGPLPSFPPPPTPEHDVHDH